MNMGVSLKDRRPLSPMEAAVQKAQEYFGDLMAMYAEQEGVDPESLSSGAWEPSNKEAKMVFMESLYAIQYKGDYEEAWEWAVNNDLAFMYYREEEHDEP